MTMNVVPLLGLAALQSPIVLQEPMAAEEIVSATYIKCKFGEFFVTLPRLGNPPIISFGIKNTAGEYQVLFTQKLPDRPILLRAGARCDDKYRLSPIDVWYSTPGKHGWRYQTIRVNLGPGEFVRAGPVNEIDQEMFWRMFG